MQKFGRYLYIPKGQEGSNYDIIVYHLFTYILVLSWFELCQGVAMYWLQFFGIQQYNSKIYELSGNLYAYELCRSNCMPNSYYELKYTYILKPLHAYILGTSKTNAIAIQLFKTVQLWYFFHTAAYQKWMCLLLEPFPLPKDLKKTGHWKTWSTLWS